MIKHFCDRCGKEVAFEALTFNKFDIKPSINLYTDICKESRYLCPACQSDLMWWVREAEDKNYQISSEDEHIESMQKKIDNITCIGNNICFYLRDITASKQPNLNAYLNLGKLMEEWKRSI